MRASKLGVLFLLALGLQSAHAYEISFNGFGSLPD